MSEQLEITRTYSDIRRKHYEKNNAIKAVIYQAISGLMGPV